MDGMLADMTPRQLQEWQAYLGGLAETDDQLNMATMTSLIVNELRHLRYVVSAIVSKEAKPDKAIKPSDLQRTWRDETNKGVKVKSTAELFAMFKQYG